MKYRPWGDLNWVLSKLIKIKEWTFWGCISSEFRTTAAFSEITNLKYSNNIKDYYFTLVENPPSHFSVEISRTMDEYKALINSYKLNVKIDSFDLQYSDDSIIYNYINSVIDSSNGNILLDISCFPKRYFFPIVKYIIKSGNSKIKNFVVLNAIPERYREGDLSGDFSEWKTIPFFSDSNPEQKKDIVLLAVGHMPMSSLEPIQDLCSSSKLKLFFPFPGNLPSYHLSWEFVYKIKQVISTREDAKIIDINAYDVSELYDHLLDETNIESAGAVLNSLIAPYGPKAFSLAMAIFASNFDIPVYYTQPRLYFPDYSIGIDKKDGRPNIKAYCIVLNGRMLY